MTCHLSDSLRTEHDLCWQPESAQTRVVVLLWKEAVRFVFH